MISPPIDARRPGRADASALQAAGEVSAAASLDASLRVVSATPAFDRVAGHATAGFDFLELVAEGRTARVHAFLESVGPEWDELDAALFPDALGVPVDYVLRARATRDGISVVVEPDRAPSALLNAQLLALNDELIAARRELAAKNKRLTELDRLKDDILAGVTHDLKTPLTSINGFAELIRDAPEDVDLTASAAERIIRNSRRLFEMVEELMLGAQIAAGRYVPELEPVALDELVRTVVAECAPQAAECSIELSVETEPVEVCGDRPKLQGLIENLVSNAVKYTENGGNVRVRVASAAGTASVEVADDGIGIAPDETAQVFERFYRASNGRMQAKGTGIGLANAKAVAEAHGGSISLTSELGRGSSFTLELPASR